MAAIGAIMKPNVALSDHRRLKTCTVLSACCSRPMLPPKA
jgi:hypothetical protein